MPVISIILPVHNGAPWLRESIESVLAQSFTDFELLVCDDRSTDSTPDIVRSYRDPRIRFFPQGSGSGLFSTLNFLIGHARGEFLRLWSQDDVLRPHCLNRELFWFRRHPNAGFWFTYYDMINGDGTVTQQRPRREEAVTLPPAWSSQIMFYHGQIAGNIANVTLNPAALKQVGLFRTDMYSAGDFDLLVRIAREFDVGCIYEPLMFLRAHKGQFSQARGTYVHQMIENSRIYSELIQTLPAQIDREYARTYLRRNLHVQFASYALRCALHGDFANACRALRHVNNVDNALVILFWCLVSANRRFFRVGPQYRCGLEDIMTGGGWLSCAPVHYRDLMVREGDIPLPQRASAS
jgi:glycosyltransferase involved in cell wall biosynthesis